MPSYTGFAKSLRYSSYSFALLVPITRSTSTPLLVGIAVGALISRIDPCNAVFLRLSADVCTPSGIQRLIITFTSLSSYNPLVLWPHNNISPDSQMSSSECSLSEERMQGRHPFYRGFVIRRRVQRSTGMVYGEIAFRYILILDGTFRSHYLARLNPNPH